MYRNFDNEYEKYGITKKHREFIEWCRTKFNIEELGPCTITNYTDFVKTLYLPEYTYKAARDKQIDALRVFCDIEVNKRKYTIKDILHIEQQEFTESGNSSYGIYKVAFELLFNDWFNHRNSNDYFPSTEEIAMEMGLLDSSYYDLRRKYGEEKSFHIIQRGTYCDGVNYSNLDLIHKIDWEKRMEALIITQLKSMMVDKRNNKNYNISETFVYKTIRTEIIDGIETRIIEYRGELSDIERKKIYAKIDAIQTMYTTMEKNSISEIKHDPNLSIYYSDLRKLGIYPVWKIIATPRAKFEPLPEDFKKLLIKILINNKQNKVHRVVDKIHHNKYGTSIDADDSIALDFREDLLLVENILDGESLYKEIKNDDGTVDYIRLVCGRQIQEQRDSFKLSESAIF